MKCFTAFLPLLALFILPNIAFSQLTNGGTDGYFGIDGDTRANYVKYGPSTGNIPTDDWFAPFGGRGVIDTTNASVYSALLQANGNMGFNKMMSALLYSKINGKLWLDAVYGRDYIATMPLTDSTAFTIASKNGDNPINWQGGATNFPDKNDLVDVFAHMRRDGTTVHDSLWLFTGAATVGTSGSKYFDIELYKKTFSYNSSTGAFSTAGTDAGHTQWTFDASGNITQTGDMIIAVNFTPGSAPVVDVRIWVSQPTYASVIPAYFNFGPNFDGASASPAFGYASILSKTGSTAFGSGISNYSATATADTTWSTPWGTEQSTKNWGTQYLSQQLIEVGLNLTRIGIDPALYSSIGLDPCQSLFSSIFFKSRSSNSFVSNMHDFVTPLTFLRQPLMDYTTTPDTLRCNHPAGLIQVTNVSTAGYYTWTTPTGSITGSNSDSTQISLNKPGTYIVKASPALGCTPTRTDTIIIPIDTFPPVASINAGIIGNMSAIQFYGGDLVASNYPTPFGGSKGLDWNWSGPGGFSSAIQNPTNDTTWGTYQLVVTEKRNGCTDTAQKTFNFTDFSVLAQLYIRLSGALANETVKLEWTDRAFSDNAYYQIERSSNGVDFSCIGSVKTDGGILTAGTFDFVDHNPLSVPGYYRIRAIEKSGSNLISNTITINMNQKNDSYSIRTDQQSRSYFVSQVSHEFDGILVIYNTTGAIASRQKLHIYKGFNVVDISAMVHHDGIARVFGLFDQNQLVFSQKFIP